MNRSAQGKRRGPITCLAALLVFIFLIACENDPPAPQKTATSAAPPEQTFQGTLVAVGDSLTAGLGVAEEMAYPAQLARKLEADGLHYNVINAGVSGETSSGARSRLQWVLSSLKPDIVILETGANDGLRGIDTRLMEANLDSICTTLKANNIQVVLAGMQMLPNLGPEYAQSFAAVFPRVARRHDLILIPFFLQQVAGDTALNQSDRLHPTPEGYTRIVENIYPYVLKAIKKHQAAHK